MAHKFLRVCNACVACVSVSDLAPGQSGVDDMRLLEQKAQQLAAEAEQDRPKAKDKILFVRCVLRPGQRRAAEKQSEH